MASNFDSNPDSTEPSTDILNPQPEPQQEHKEGNDDNDNNSQGNFFEENKSLLTKVYNILKLKFPNLNISLSELITAAQKYIDMYANNPGNGDGVIAEGDEDTNAIVRGFFKIYKTDWEEFKNAVLNGGSFEEKKPDESFEKELYIDKNISEFKKQDELRIKEINKAVDYIKKNESISNDNEIKQKLVEFCLNDKTATLDYIEYLLKVFYDKWLLPDGSGNRFPYVINNNARVTKDNLSYVRSQDQRSLGQGVAFTNDNLPKHFKSSEKSLDENNNFIIASKYANRIKTEKTEKGTFYLVDNSDYFISYIKKIKAIKDIKKIFNHKEDTNYKSNDYDYQLYKAGDCDITQGKGAIERLNALSQKLLNEYNKLDNSSKAKLKESFNLFYPSEEYLFKNYLHDFSLGVDCSGYVSRALAFVMTNLMIEKEEQEKTLGALVKGDGLRTNTHFLEEDGAKELFKCAEQKFSDDLVKKIQPGDFARNGDHIKIISEVNTSSFTDHQSSSASSRVGVIETVTTSSNYNKNYKKPYSFMRPIVFNDDKKLIEYFKNMLTAKGKESN